MVQLVENPPAIWEIWVQSLGWEDTLEKGKATHSSIWPGDFHGLYSPRGHKELDMTATFTFTVLRGTTVYSFFLGSALQLPAEAPGASSPVACAVTGPRWCTWGQLCLSQSRMGPRGPLPRRLSPVLQLSPGATDAPSPVPFLCCPPCSSALCPPNRPEPLRCD